VIAVLVGLLARTAGRLGLPGIALPVGPEPTASDPLITDERFLGRRVSLDEARGQVTFDIAMPSLRGLPELEVYLSGRWPGLAGLPGCGDHPVLRGCRA
jgi:hypothetical protein